MQLTRTRTLPLPSQWYFPNPRRELKDALKDFDDFKNKQQKCMK